ncbi:MAG: hypothetical protein PHO89_01725 [Methylacidiphilaceae bacterium]|nr:hypothetical protein [Candidatus Methylacidiphilaceae bacterium]
MKRRNRLSRKWWLVTGLSWICAGRLAVLHAEGTAADAAADQGQSAQQLRQQATALQDKAGQNQALASGDKMAAGIEKQGGHPQQAQIDQTRAAHLESKAKAEDAQAVKDMREAKESKDHPVAGGQGTSAGGKGTALSGSGKGGNSGGRGNGGGSAPGWAERARAEGLQQEGQQRFARGQMDKTLARDEAMQGHMNQAQMYREQAQRQDQLGRQEDRQAVRDWNRSEGTAASEHPRLASSGLSSERGVGGEHPHLSGGMSGHPHLSGGMGEHLHLSTRASEGGHPHLHAAGGRGMAGHTHAPHMHATHVHTPHVHAAHVHGGGRR